MRNKRKGILMASAILGSAAIVSTGFAAWVITINGTTEAQGTIDVDTVNDESITLRVLESYTYNEVDYTQDALVKFGAAKDTVDGSKGWLTVKDSDVTEDLVAKFYIEVTGYNFINTTTPFEFTLTEKTGESYYSNAVDAGYVKSLENVSKTANLISSNGNVAVYEVTLTFAWGAYFENVNPTNFYNKYDYNKTRGDTSATGGTSTTSLLDDAKTVLLGEGAGVYAQLGSASFKLVIASKRDTNA